MRRNLEQEMQGYSAELGKQEAVGGAAEAWAAAGGGGASSASVTPPGKQHVLWAVPLLLSNQQCSRALHCCPNLCCCPDCCHDAPPWQVIRGLEREKDRFAAEAAGVQAKHAAAVEEVALRDAAIADLQRKIAGGAGRAIRLMCRLAVPGCWVRPWWWLS